MRTPSLLKIDIIVLCTYICPHLSFVLQETWGAGGQDTKKKHFLFSAISLSLHRKALSQCEQLGMEEHRAGGFREGRGDSGSIGLGSPAV